MVNEGADLTAHLHSLIRVFIVHLEIYWTDEKARLRSDYEDVEAESDNSSRYGRVYNKMY